MNDAELRRALGAAERALEAANARADTRRQRRDELVAEALARGWTQRAVAEVLGISVQRVQQLASRLRP